MYRLLAIAKYDERYVIPPAHAEQAHSLEELATECAVSEYGGGNPEIFGEGSGALTPIAVENFQMLPGPADLGHDRLARRARRRGSTCSTGTARALRRGHLPAAPRRGPDRTTRASEPRLRGPARERALPADQLTVAWQSASLLLGYPDEGLVGQLELVERAAHDAARRASAGRSGRTTAHLRFGAAGRAAGGVRRDVRHPSPAQPVPDLLRPRRHPQARGGAAPVQADLPRAPGSSSTTASSPTTSASCSSTPPPSTTSSAGGCCWTTAPASSCCGLSLDEVGSAGPARSTAVTATLPPLAGDEWDAVRRLAAEGPPEEEVGLTPYATPGFDPGPAGPHGGPSAPPEPALLPMPSFPGAR